MSLETKEVLHPVSTFDMDWKQQMSWMLPSSHVLILLFPVFVSFLYNLCLREPSHLIQNKQHPILLFFLLLFCPLSMLIPFKWVPVFVWEHDAIREPMLGCTGWSPAADLWICLHAFRSGASIDPGASCYRHRWKTEKKKKKKNLEMNVNLMVLIVWPFWRPLWHSTGSCIWHPHILSPCRNQLPSA